MQLFNPIHKAELISIVEEASAKAAKNAGVVQELVFPHIYFVLSKRLSVVGDGRENGQNRTLSMRPVRLRP